MGLFSRRSGLVVISGSRKLVEKKHTAIAMAASEVFDAGQIEDGVPVFRIDDLLKFERILADRGFEVRERT